MREVVDIDLASKKLVADANGKTDQLSVALNVLHDGNNWIGVYGIGTTINVVANTIKIVGKIGSDLAAKNWLFTTTEIYRQDSGAYIRFCDADEYSANTKYWSVETFKDNIVVTNYEDFVAVKSDIDGVGNFAPLVYNSSGSVTANFSSRTITAAANDFDGFQPGMTVKTTSSNNPGVYLIESIGGSGESITVSDQDNEFAGETGVSVTIDECPYKARFCVEYKERMIYANCQSANVPFPRMLQITGTATMASTEPSENTGAGMIEIPGPGEEVIGLRQLGDNLIIYMTDSVWRLSFTGFPLWFQLDKMFDARAVIYDGGIAVIDTAAHLTLAHDDIYIVTAEGVAPIGKANRKHIKTLLSYAQRMQVSSVIDYNNKMAVFNVPLTNDAQRLFYINYENGIISEGAESYESLGVYVNETTKEKTFAAIQVKGDFLCADTEEPSIMEDGDGNIIVASNVSYEVAELNLNNAPSAVCRLTTGEIDFGRKVFLREIRPIVNLPSGDFIIRVHYRNDDNDSCSTSEKNVGSSGNGKAYFRLSARYMKYTIETDGITHSGISGLKVLINKREGASNGL